MTFRAAVLLLTLPLLLVVACDSSGTNDTSGSPDSVEGTWEGSISLSVEVDTTDFDGNSIQGTGEFKRSYRLVIADDNGDLSVSATVEREGFIERTGDLAPSRSREEISGSIEFATTGTYGPPSMNIELPGGYPPRSAKNRWDFKVSGDEAIDTLDVYPATDDPGTSRNWVTNALQREGKDTKLTLTRQPGN